MWGVVASLVALGGGAYLYKRSKGAAAPAVAPTHPQNPPVVPPSTPSAVLASTSSGPSALLAAVTGGDTTQMSRQSAQAAINAANSAGAFASSDLGQAAGAGDTSSAFVSDQPPVDTTANDSSALDNAIAGL